MNVLKLALLSTAVVTAVSVSAHAENLEALKAQMDSLTLDAVADAPAAAPTTSIAWSGNIRAGVVVTYDPIAANQYATDVESSARLKVVAKTDTAVGEVGVSFQLRGIANETRAAYNAGNGNLVTDGYYGYWKFTPNLTLSAGIQNPIEKGTLAKNIYSFDFICTCYYGNDGWGAIFNAPVSGRALNDSSSQNPAQFALTYADGPIGVAVALEDANNVGNNSAFGGSAKIGYKLDAVGFDVSGGYWGNPNGGNAAWTVNGGVGVNLNPITIGGSFGVGHMDNVSAANIYDYSAGSLYATAKLGDAASIELGFVHDFGTAALAQDRYAGASLFEGAVYYTPVKQLVVGLEGQYQSGGLQDGGYLASVVTAFKF